VASPARTLWVLSIAVFLVMTGISIVSPVLPLYAESFGVSAFLIGLLVGALPAARVVLDLPSGILGDRFGNRRMMTTGLGIVAGTSFLAVIPAFLQPGVVPYAILLAIRVCEGIGSAFYVTSSLASLARSAPADRRGAHMSVYVSALLTGQVVGPVIGGGAAAVGGLSAPFVVYGGLALVGLLLIALFLPATAEVAEARRIDWTAVRRLLGDRDFVIVNVGTMAAFFIRAGLINTVLPFHTAHVLGIPLDTAAHQAQVAGYTGLLITTVALASLATMWPAGRWSDRRGRKGPFVASLVLIGVTAPFIYLARDWWTLVAVMVLYGLFLGLHGPLASWASDLIAPAQMGTGMGLYRTIGDLGFLLGPLAMGAALSVVASDTDVTMWPFLLAGAWMAASGLLLLLARDPVGQRLRAGRAGGSVAAPVHLQK
jgi:MFS family permease